MQRNEKKTAVALEYEAGDQAPKVVATGRGKLAERIIDVAKEELNSKARPEIKGDIDISKYDTIYIGWPCWWGTLPMCMFTFIEKHDWTGKTVIPFTTHEGSGFGSGLSDLKAAVKGATVTKGLSIQGTNARSSDAQIKKFVAASTN